MKNEKPAKTGSKDQIVTKVKLPPITVSKEEWDAQMKRTLKNLTLRPTQEQAEMLVWLDLECNVPKATVAKECLDQSLPKFFDELSGRIQKWSARFSEHTPD